MTENHIAPSTPTPEAATDEPAFPVFTSPEAEEAYWQGVTHGIRSAGREPGHPHMPADFDLDLTRDGASPTLVSRRLVEPRPEEASMAPVLGRSPANAGVHGHERSVWAPAFAGEQCTPARAPRHDGWTPARERQFCETLADCGVVADACRACGMSRDAAYAYRRRAAGRAFALAWDAALLLARSRVSDDVMSRAVHGVIDRVYRDGELVAERHRYDNRLTMAVLSRLDRQAEGFGENAPVVRAIAQEYDRFLDVAAEGAVGAEGFLAARFPPADGNRPLPPWRKTGVEEAPLEHGQLPDPDTELARLARSRAYEKFGVGLPSEIDTDDLDVDEMERWTDTDLDRAEFCGLLVTLDESDWPDAARDPSRDDTDGMCKLRKLYLDYNSPEDDEEEDGDEEDWDEEEEEDEDDEDAKAEREVREQIAAYRAAREGGKAPECNG
ncbi:hypothetical protein [Allosphingosinicella humi]